MTSALQRLCDPGHKRKSLPKHMLISAMLCRDALLDLIFRALHQQHPACGLQMKHLQQADALLQGDQGVIIMLCGTAGTGKSTLASLLGQRLGITTILSTDSIRHMLRCFTATILAFIPPLSFSHTQLPLGQQGRCPARSQEGRAATTAAASRTWRHCRAPAAPCSPPWPCRGFVPEEQDPVLHASTYESDTAVLKMRPDLSDEPPRRLVKIGYKAQSSVVLARLEGLVAMWHAAGRSAIVEGVHLHLKAVMRLMQQYPSIMPFLVRLASNNGAGDAYSPPDLHLMLMPLTVRAMGEKDRPRRSLDGIRQLSELCSMRCSELCLAHM